MYPGKKNAEKGQWWDRAWSLVDGCTPVSEGCDNCWSRAMGQRFGKWPAVVTPRWDRLELPMKVKMPTIWAVWNDLFHEDVPRDFIYDAFRVMEKAKQHRFLVLTKRAMRMDLVLNGESGAGWEAPPLSNVWLGVTAENQARLDERVPYLLRMPAAVKFLSLEPLLGPVDTRPFKLLKKRWGTLPGGISWIIIGCETGPHRRSCALEWVQDIIQQADEAQVPVWVKALDFGGRVSKDMNEWPAWARRREMS